MDWFNLSDQLLGYEDCFRDTDVPGMKNKNESERRVHSGYLFFLFGYIALFLGCCHDSLFSAFVVL